MVVADTTEPDPVGTESYRRMMALLAEIGPEAFVRTIQAEDWEFVHDQWGAQTWTKLLAKIPCDHIFYYSPQTAMGDYPILACADPAPLLAGAEGRGAGEAVAHFVAAAVARACEESEATPGREPTVAYLAGGRTASPWGRGPPAPDRLGGEVSCQRARALRLRYAGNQCCSFREEQECRPLT